MGEIKKAQAGNEFETALLDSLSGAISAEGITRFEDEVMRQCPQVDIETSDFLHDGIYCRTITVPAGVMVTGALLTKPNIAIISGSGVVNTDQGMVQLDGYHIIASEGGQKRIGWAKEKTYFTMIMRTDAKTVAEAEREMTSDVEYQKLQTVIKQKLEDKTCQQ